jgi:hypothetical protein
MVSLAYHTVSFPQIHTPKLYLTQILTCCCCCARSAHSSTANERKTRRANPACCFSSSATHARMARCHAARSAAGRRSISDWVGQKRTKEKEREKEIEKRKRLEDDTNANQTEAPCHVKMVDMVIHTHRSKSQPIDPSLGPPHSNAFIMLPITPTQINQHTHLRHESLRLQHTAHVCAQLVDAQRDQCRQRRRRRR